jgi:hypothetical protein
MSLQLYEMQSRRMRFPLGRLMLTGQRPLTHESGRCLSCNYSEFLKCAPLRWCIRLFGVNISLFHMGEHVVCIRACHVEVMVGSVLHLWWHHTVLFNSHV